MKKHLWRRILTAGCVASLFMTSPGMAVLADELPAPEAASVGATSEETAEDNKIVGDGVTATFDASTGEVVFYSDGGTLWRDWLEKLEIEREAIKAIRVSESSEIVFLPADSSELFRGCEGLTSINLNKFDTSNVTNMRDMFYSCEGLTNLDLSSFDTSNVTEMNGMFAACDSLTNLDLSSFDTSNVTDMDCMFYYCNGLTNLDLSSFNTSNVTDMADMFRGCNSLTNLDLSSFDTSNVTDMGGMFDDCNSLTNLDLSSFDTSNVTVMGSMFSGCESLINLDLSSFDTSNVTVMGGMFYGCESLINLDLSSFDTSNVTGMTGMNFMFYHCNSLTNLDLSSFDTSNVREMGVMFSGCESLINLDLSSFDTSNVTAMGAMFYGCESLINLDLSSFDTSNVTDMGYMFASCESLTNLDLSSFDTSNVTEMSRMFNGCNCLEVLKTPKINNVSIELPLAMYDKDGNTYTDLPILSESIVLASSQQLAGETSNPVSGIKFDKDTVIIKKGSSEKLIATVLPNTAFNKNLNWSSSDENVATVDENGLVTAVSEGSADITVTTDDGGFTAVCKVEIAKKIAFKDVADENLWYYDSVYWAVENGVTSGMGEGTFQPMAKLSRAQAVTFLYNLAGRPDVSGLQAKEFTDVSNTAWYYNAVKWAVANKITSGYGTGTFQPNATCNRAMIVTFLANYAKAAGTYKEPTTSASFKDVKAKDWFRKSVDWAVENGITSGYGQGTFSPNVTCNRAMMVTFLKKVAELPKV